MAVVRLNVLATVRTHIENCHGQKKRTSVGVNYKNDFRFGNVIMCMYVGTEYTADYLYMLAIDIESSDVIKREIICTDTHFHCTRTYFIVYLYLASI